MTYNEFKAEYLPKLQLISDNASFELETMMQAVSGMKKSELLLTRCNVLDREILEKLTSAVKRRLEFEPLQYIIGEWEFFGLRMFCGKGCLIPRPETEMLAEIAIKKLPRNGKLLDLCTGSGCISVAVLNNRPDVTAVAVDISKDALEYAKRNAEYHGISPERLKFICADIYEYTPNFLPDVIVSNPPYIKSDDMSSLSPEVLFEPAIALDGGHDGLDFYKLIAKYFANKFISDKGYCAVEVGYDIGEEVAAIFRSQKFSASLLRDMFEVERVCLAQKE
ncbi:MAG: peptide chain release factor N(5)-glutamine methyltransferase [Clostridia bacterium]|nr:peptide chain release factor N(5)-glutamine methyltransferase [Clostridia bacterium]